MLRPPIKSSSRTLEVLELFYDERRPLRLKFIFEKLCYPQSSTTILLKSMVMRGYLKYDRRFRTYFPTPRVAALGDWVNHYVYGGDELEQMMQEVFECTNETVAVSSQNDIFIQHLRVLQPEHEAKIFVPQGSMRVLTHSAPGLALMSLMDAKSVDKLCRHINIHIRDRAMQADLEQVTNQLKAIRAEGYALLAAFPFGEASAIAMNLPNPAHGAALTIGVGGLNARIVQHRSDILAVLREAISRYAGKVKARLGDEAEPGVGEAPACERGG